MIKYDPLWRTLKEKGISQYQLIKDYGIDKAQLQRLRQNLRGGEGRHAGGQPHAPENPETSGRGLPR